MVICVDAECLHGKEWEATLEVEALVGLVLESFLVHETLSVSELTPAAFFNISSNNRGFIADIAAVFQKQFMVSLLERGGYSFVCVPHLEGVAPGPGDLPGSDYSVELIRCFGPYPGKSALQGTDIALYELSFVDKGFPGLTIEPLPGVAPSGAPEGVTPSGAPEGVTPFYPSVLEERPRSTGDYGD